MWKLEPWGSSKHFEKARHIVSSGRLLQHSGKDNSAIFSF